MHKSYLNIIDILSIVLWPTRCFFHDTMAFRPQLGWLCVTQFLLASWSALWSSVRNLCSSSFDLKNGRGGDPFDHQKSLKNLRI